MADITTIKNIATFDVPMIPPGNPDNYQPQKFLHEDPKFVLGTSRPSILRRMFGEIHELVNKAPLNDKYDVEIEFAGKPLVLHYRRPLNEGTPTVYYDNKALDDLNNALNTTISFDDAQSLLHIGNFAGDAERTVNFNQGSKKTTVSRATITPIWTEMTAKADEAHLAKFDMTAAKRYETIKQFGKKPDGWPKSDTLEFEIDGHKLAMVYAPTLSAPVTNADAPEWSITKDSLPELANLYTERLRKTIPDTAIAKPEIVNRLGIASNRYANHRKELDKLIKELRTLADVLSVDDLTATVKIKGKDQEFKLSRKNDSATWMLEPESLPAIAQNLGLPPYIADDIRMENNTGLFSDSTRGFTPSDAYASTVHRIPTKGPKTRY